MTTITTSTSTGIVLTSPSYVNPILINPGITISNYGSAAVSATIGSWTIQNDGSIAGTGVTSGTAVYLGAGGSVTNAASASITSSFLDSVEISGGAGTVVNSGIIAGGLIGSGVYFHAGGAVTNVASASIAGFVGVDILSGVGTVANYGNITGLLGIGVILETGGTVVNAGSIAATGTSGVGVDLLSGGSVTNAASASITGVFRGVEISGGAGTVANYGSIAGTGTSGRGVFLLAGGSVTNATSASITGGYTGLSVYGAAGTALNYGRIGGASRNGVGLNAGGSVTNAASGSITGAYDGVGIAASAGTVVNDGSIAATGTNGRGVFFNVGGSVTNAASASITGGYRGVYINGSAGTVVNDGSIAGTGTSGRGVELGSGGSVTNAADGSIAGGDDGVSMIGAAGTVANYGSIAGGPAGSGVFLNTGGSVTNAASASITGADDGVGISGGTGAVVNDGRIAGTGTSGLGVYLHSGGVVTNAASGSITGSLFAGIRIAGGAGTVVNDGSIASMSVFGIRLSDGGSITNAASASITGGTLGVYLETGGTLTDAGTIIGNTGTAISFGGTGSNLLTLDPGYGLSGLALGGASATNTLELASAASTGMLSGLGTEFVDFMQTTIDADASWVFNGANTIEAGATLTELSGATLTVSGTLVNDGVIVIDPSTLTVADLTGTGQVTIDAGSTLEVQGTITAGETIMFDGVGADLRLDSPDSVAGSVTNFAGGETINLQGIAPASVSYAGGVLSFSGGSFPLSLTNPGSLTVSASGGGAAISVLCFRADTLILTPSGERPIQELVVGDEVRTHRGEARSIVWIGTRSIDCARHPDPSAVRPVCIEAGALGDGVPRRDLYVSPDHAMLLDGHLIPAHLLCNGATIHQPPVRHARYFHLELETHDILVAEGAPAESYLDTGNRAAFENAGVPMMLHPDFAYGQHLRETRSCAPFAADAASVEPVWRRLAARAQALGYELPEPETTDDPDFRLKVDDREIRPLSTAGNRHVFVLPPDPSSVRLLSRAAAPCETRPWIDDRRRLGVMVRRITLRHGQEERTIPPDHPTLADGWWAVERDAAMGRWTDGDAALPVPPDAALTLEVELAGTVPYPSCHQRPPSTVPRQTRRLSPLM